MAAHLFLGKDEVPVHPHVKYPPGRGDELHLGSEFLAKLRRQTGGARFVVSDDAVCDGDVHRAFLAREMENPSASVSVGKGASLILER